MNDLKSDKSEYEDSHLAEHEPNKSAHFLVPGVANEGALDEHQVQLLVSMGLANSVFNSSKLTFREEIMHPNLAAESESSAAEEEPDGSFKHSAFVRWFLRIDEEKIRPFLIYKYGQYCHENHHNEEN